MYGDYITVLLVIPFVNACLWQHLMASCMVLSLKTHAPFHDLFTQLPEDGQCLLCMQQLLLIQACCIQICTYALNKNPTSCPCAATFWSRLPLASCSVLQSANCKGSRVVCLPMYTIKEFVRPKIRVTAGIYIQTQYQTSSECCGKQSFIFKWLCSMSSYSSHS